MTDFVSLFFTGDELSNPDNYAEASYCYYDDGTTYACESYGEEVEASLSIDMILEGRADPGVYLFFVVAALFLAFMGVFLVMAVGMGYDSGEMASNIEAVMKQIVNFFKVTIGDNLE